MNIRRGEIERYAQEIAQRIKESGSANIVYVCTHNSRRSQFAQFWSAYHTDALNLPITSYSAGTERTACHSNVLEVLRQEGFSITSEGANHKVILNHKSFVELSSKTLNSVGLPERYFAIMTCSDADENCPYIPGALDRFRLTFEDPKWSDNSAEAIQVYQDTSKQISTDIKYLLEQININL